MSPVWITQSDLGIYAINHNFNDTPVTIQYSADTTATVTLVSGELPPGVTAEFYPSNIRLVGVVDPNSYSQTYAFTYRVTNLDGNYSERQFYVELVKNPVPMWITQGQLPTQNESYSYTLNPVNLEFSADSAATVTLLNGTFPVGLQWVKTAISSTLSRITITGESVGLTTTINYKWTFRITNPNGTVADRTFYLTIVPLVEFPNWTSQQPFLGYVGSTRKTQFQVKANIVGNSVILYSLIGTIPSGMTIDPPSGLITWYAPSVVTNTNYSFVVRASTQVAYTDITLNATVLYAPQPPVWVTPNILKSIPQGSYLQYPIEAFDAQDNPITYTITTADPDFPFSLDLQGLMYGEAPAVTSDKFWTVYITATSSTGSSVRDFSFEVTKVNEAGVLSWRNNTVDIIGLPDGTLTVIDVGASSTRTPTVLHGITGGQVPPGLVLDKAQGKLVGFLDYHAVDKDYWFDIFATDGIDNLVRTIHLQVTSQYGYQFASLSIPVSGDIKQLWISTVQYIVTNPNSIPNVQVVGNTLWYPSLSLVRGLNSTITDPNEILKQIVNYNLFETGLNYDDPLLRLKLSIGEGNTAIVDSYSNVLLYREIIDPQDDTSYTAGHTGLPTAIKPPSINGIRNAFINACGFANSGSGSGASLLASINPEDGSFTSVNIISSGSGYTTHPNIIVRGTGKGAKLQAIMKLVGVFIRDPGQKWEIGEYITLNIGNYTTPAELVVTTVGPLGELINVYVLNSGSYLEMPIGKLWIRNSAGIICGIDPDLGLGKVQVISSGSGYKQESTTVSLEGSEILEPWQTNYKPYLPVALITPTYSNTIVNNSQLEITQLLDGAIWQVGDFIWSVEGLFWQGTTSFDSDYTTWDGNTTCFEETLEPTETIFDENHNTYELYMTQFDVGPGVGRDARLNWGQTGFDEWTTAFEFYATIFDAIEPPRESRTTVKRLVSLNMPQWSGNNAADWSIE